MSHYLNQALIKLTCNFIFSGHCTICTLKISAKRTTNSWPIGLKCSNHYLINMSLKIYVEIQITQIITLNVVLLCAIMSIEINTRKIYFDCVLQTSLLLNNTFTKHLYLLSSFRLACSPRGHKCV